MHRSSSFQLLPLILIREVRKYTVNGRETCVVESHSLDAFGATGLCVTVMEQYTRVRNRRLPAEMPWVDFPAKVVAFPNNL
jgi:hypothetical protein